MNEQAAISPIAHIRTDFPSKFGIPRQSGLVEQLCAHVIFEPPYRQEQALRELEGFSHIWLIWQFSACADKWSLTVRPPRLGGNRKVGVFASRSPFRPNHLGLSCVQLLAIEHTCAGPQLLVGGADLLDGTPIYDIKPYIPLTDCRPQATQGYTAYTREHQLQVHFPPALLQQIPKDRQQALLGVLACDPRPGYEADPARVYGMCFAGFDIGFTVQDDLLQVCRVTAAAPPDVAANHSPTP